MNSKSIIGIGNALMDIVVKLNDDTILEKNKLPKGSMTLVDSATSASLNHQTEGMEKILAAGGSVANTIDGLAHLGAQTSFIGKVGNDELGRIYYEDLKNIGVKPHLFKSFNPTGVAMALVTPDSERTFGTYLGVAVEMSPNDLSSTLFEGHNIAYVEGYLVQNHNLVRQAASLAKNAGLSIALDLASYNVVEENLDFLKEIASEYVDIIFANEEESKAFTGKNPRESVKELSKLCHIAVVKTGAQGSLICSGKEFIEIGVTGNSCVDTTGAGDLYAAGFLYGYSLGLPLEKCGKIASVVAGKVISIYGARMNETMWEQIKAEVSKII